MMWSKLTLTLQRESKITNGMEKRILDADTNVCCFSRKLLANSGGLNIVRRINDSGVDVKFLDGTRDIWCRDYMPIQITEDTYIGYEFTPDYLDTKYNLTYQTNPARINRALGLDIKQTGIILDGGNVVKTSKGIIMVDKVFNENCHIPKEKLINRLEKYFGCEIIFLPWDKEEKYGHADGIVREISDGHVLMTNYHQYDRTYADKFIKILSSHFDVDVLDYNVKSRCRYNWCYINFLRIGNKVFIPQLTWEDYSDPKDAACSPEANHFKGKGKWFHSRIEEDNLALTQFRTLMPECEIIPVSCPQIVEDGGALNCISWNIKR